MLLGKTVLIGDLFVLLGTCLNSGLSSYQLAEILSEYLVVVMRFDFITHDDAYICEYVVKVLENTDSRYDGLAQTNLCRPYCYQQQLQQFTVLWQARFHH